MHDDLRNSEARVSSSSLYAKNDKSNLLTEINKLKSANQELDNKRQTQAHLSNTSNRRNEEVYSVAQVLYSRQSSQVKTLEEEFISKQTSPAQHTSTDKSKYFSQNSFVSSINNTDKRSMLDTNEEKKVDYQDQDLANDAFFIETDATK